MRLKHIINSSLRKNIVKEIQFIFIFVISLVWQAETWNALWKKNSDPTCCHYYTILVDAYSPKVKVQRKMINYRFFCVDVKFIHSNTCVVSGSVHVHFLYILEIDRIQIIYTAVFRLPPDSVHIFFVICFTSF